jgi:Na+/H+ antiporter NhaD/arsenite permease-like protein
MAITLDCTGVLQAAAFWVSNKGGKSGRKLYFYFYLLLTVISMVVGNDPVILSGTVFLVYYTKAVGLDPDAWLISEFAAANTASMVLFVGNPTNVVICEGFSINNAAFTAYTILPFLACSIACYLALMLQYRNEKHVPKTLKVSGALDPREVLRDPIGAIFGSIWLAICLVVVIVLSFIHVDVWKIVLPFAGGKFVFDIAWDHYRYTTGKIPKFNEENDDDDDAESPSDAMATAFQRAMSSDMQRNGTAQSFASVLKHHDEEDPLANSRNNILESGAQRAASPAGTASIIHKRKPLFPAFRRRLRRIRRRLAAHFPTFSTAFPRLPFGLIPFAFSQFILIEALEHQGWIDIFSRWLVIASKGSIHPVVWLVGIFGVILCNISGTNIGATILLTKIIRTSQFDPATDRAAAVALAVASNIGAVSFTFSASLAGLLWVAILKDKGITIKQWRFAMWNSLPLLAMTGVGLGVVSAMMAVLY